jgi:hypothetical protein
MQILSWAELVIGLVVAGVLWYGYILLRYYRKEIKAWGKGSGTGHARVKGSRGAGEVNQPPVRGNLHQPTAIDPHAAVHELMQELKLVFAAAVKDSLSKDQIIEAIGIRLEKYSMLPSEIKDSISQHITNEFSLQVNMSVTLSAIQSLW